MRGCLFALALLLASVTVAARDAREVGDWLSGRIFKGGDVVLAFMGDGFFGMKIAPPDKSLQNITGLWRLSPDGVELTLFNLQDAEIRLSVGRDALHATLGTQGHISLEPANEESETFRITGLLERSNSKTTIHDAASGRIFEVGPDPAAAPGRFAVAEIEIGKDGVRGGKILKHSRPVPRFYETQERLSGQDTFAKSISGRFWLLPPIKNAKKTAIRFAVPKETADKSVYLGSFEVTGQGLRLEGSYTLSGNNLTIQGTRASVRNLEIIGAGELARTLEGQFDWSLTSRGLMLRSNGRSLLLLSS